MLPKEAAVISAIILTKRSGHGRAAAHALLAVDNDRPDASVPSHEIPDLPRLLLSHENDFVSELHVRCWFGVMERQV